MCKDRHLGPHGVGGVAGRHRGDVEGIEKGALGDTEGKTGAPEQGHRWAAKELAGTRQGCSGDSRDAVGQQGCTRQVGSSNAGRDALGAGAARAEWHWGTQQGHGGCPGVTLQGRQARMAWGMHWQGRRCLGHRTGDGQGMHGRGGLQQGCTGAGKCARDGGGCNDDGGDAAATAGMHRAHGSGHSGDAPGAAMAGDAPGDAAGQRGCTERCEGGWQGSQLRSCSGGGNTHTDGRTDRHTP